MSVDNLCIQLNTDQARQILQSTPTSEQLLWELVLWLSGSVLDLRPRATGSSLTGVTVLCP